MSELEILRELENKGVLEEYHNSEKKLIRFKVLDRSHVRRLQREDDLFILWRDISIHNNNRRQVLFQPVRPTIKVPVLIYEICAERPNKTYLESITAEKFFECIRDIEVKKSFLFHLDVMF